MEDVKVISLEDLMGMLDAWSNAACLGYAILAMERTGMGKAEIKRITGRIKAEFEHKTVGEAEAHYYDSIF
ncbi:MAG: hypothetical protein RSC06_15825 [Clostridia bacterium]